MSDKSNLKELRDSLREICAKLIYNIDEQNEIMDFIQKLEEYQQLLVQEIIKQNNNESLLLLKEAIKNIQISIASKDWIFLNQIIRNEFSNIEKVLKI